MDNSINQYAIGELLDGRYFYIPSYQRGYRWTEKQVGDLLRDLLCFANDFANEGKEKKLLLSGKTPKSINTLPEAS